MVHEEQRPERSPWQAEEDDWQDVLLREWRYCLDDVVAARLWVGVSELPPSPKAIGAVAKAAWLVTAASAFVVVCPLAFLAPLSLDLGSQILSCVAATLGLPTAVAARRIARARRAKTWGEFLGAPRNWLIPLTRAPRGKPRGFWGRDLPPELRHRHRYFWWDGRPSAAELIHAMDRPEAPEVVRELAEAVRQAKDLATDVLIGRLSSSRLAERAGAFYTLGFRGAEVLPALLAVPPDSGAMRHERAIWTAAYIAASETQRWMKAERGLLCRRCWTPFELKSVPVPTDELKRTGVETIEVAACPSCGQSRDAYEHKGPVVLTLDAAGGPEPVRVGRELWVNWLALARSESFEGQRVFECTRVEILNATDQDVAHLLVDVTSDTHPERKATWATMTCRVRASAGLGDNTLNALRGVFRGVEIQGSA